MNQEAAKEWESWLATRPPAIADLARKYPPLTRLKIHDRIMHVVSYDEYASGEVGLGISEINPATSYALGCRQQGTSLPLLPAEIGRAHPAMSETTNAQQEPLEFYTVYYRPADYPDEIEQTHKQGGL